MTGDGAALRRIPVVRARGTVTDLGTGASMTVTRAARLDWCAGVTTVRSSELTTMRRTTAVRDQLGDQLGDQLEDHQTGVPGVPGGAWLQELSRGNRSAGKGSADSITAGWAPGTLSRDTLTLNVFKLLKITQYHTNNYPPCLKMHISVIESIYFVHNLVLARG